MPRVERVTVDWSKLPRVGPGDFDPHNIAAWVSAGGAMYDASVLGGEPHFTSASAVTGIEKGFDAVMELMRRGAMRITSSEESVGVSIIRPPTQPQIQILKRLMRDNGLFIIIWERHDARNSNGKRYPPVEAGISIESLEALVARKNPGASMSQRDLPPRWGDLRPLTAREATDVNGEAFSDGAQTCAWLHPSGELAASPWGAHHETGAAVAYGTDDEMEAYSRMLQSGCIRVGVDVFFVGDRRNDYINEVSVSFVGEPTEAQRSMIAQIRRRAGGQAQFLWTQHDTEDHDEHVAYGEDYESFARRFPLRNPGFKNWQLLRPVEVPGVGAYDFVIVAFSGGKDSLACLLHLFDLGVPPARIELWHHDVDGREGSSLMDWPVTRAYCVAVAAALRLQLYFSWKAGGFEGEMLRKQSYTGDILFEVPGGTAPVRLESLKQDRFKNTRMQFPMVTADLSKRWCSAYLKIDVGSRALNNQERFNGRRTLFITGERAEESVSRASYEPFEAHRSDARSGRLRRHIDAWRPVHQWSEQRVWDIIRKYGVVPHPAYQLGWGRVSCSACIFGSKNQWASIKAANPEQFEKIARYEELFGKTIRAKESVRQLAAAGRPYRMDAATLRRALSHEWTWPIIVPPAEWQLPAGAFGDAAGPT